MSNKAIVLWLSGARLEDIRALPEVETLLKVGALVELEASPIAEPMTQHYQVMSGRTPECFGFFDTLTPRNYVVVEQRNGRGATPRLLPDMLRTVGWSVEYQEGLLPNLTGIVEEWSASNASSSACLIVKSITPSSLSVADTTVLAEVLRAARATVGETGLLVLFSDTQPVTVKRFVNVNNFLADMGIIERDEQSGAISWPNSLAYYAGYGQLWVNLLGRDAQGAVHPQGEYQEVCDTLVKALPTKLRDAETGEQVIERVYRKDELYSGEYLFCAPDLIVVFKEGYVPSERSTRLEFDDATFITPPAHTTTVAGALPSTLTGFFLAASPAFAEGVSITERSPLTAVAPTLLHALNAEYVDVDSSAISDLFTSEYLEAHPVLAGMRDQELSEEDEEKIIGHLRDLGYV
jgi:hypothetical protein